MTRTASRPASPRARPERLAQQRLAQRRQARRREVAPGLPPLLEDKLRPPRLTIEVLRRRRVTGLIDAAVAHRVTVVAAQAGAGKTVACASWAATRPASRQPAWLTVDPADREPARFWQYVLAALARVRAVGAEDAAQLAAAPPEACPQRIVAAVRGLADPVVLVIDDIHELGGSGALTGLQQLIRHAPPALRLVLSGRCPPGLSLSRLRLAGEVADIGAAELACTPPEADDYVALLGVGLPAAQREHLLRRTEGWMAGLRLAATAPPAGTAVVDYVCDEVLAAQSARTRAFLLRTSVAASLTGPLADALAGGPPGSGARALERLARQNSLVRVTGGAGGEYCYHPMLREVLAAQLDRELPGEAPALLRRAARWHAGQGQELAAVRAAGAAGDWDFGAAVLARSGAGVLAGGDPAELEQALEPFPPERRALSAPVAAALAAARLWQGDAAGAAPHLECAQRSLPALDDETRRAVSPWLTALHVMHQASGPGPDAAAGASPEWLAASRRSAAAAAASAAAVPEYRAAGLLWFAVGCALLRRWHAPAARDALASAAAQLAAGSLPVLRARALAWQALAAARCGDLTAAGTLAADALAAGPAAADRGVGCPVALARAQACLARDELAAARDQLDQAEGLAGTQAAGEPAAGVVASLLRAGCAAAEGDAPALQSLITRLRAHAAADEPLVAILAVLEAGAALAAGDRDRAADVIAADLDAADADAADSRLPGPVRMAVRLCRARVTLARGDDKGALAAAQESLASDGETTGSRVSALLTAAVAQRRLGSVSDAAQSVELALALAEPQGAYRLFLDGGSAVRSAVTILVPPTSQCAGFAGRILERFDGQQPRVAAALPAGQAGLALTGSELAVLRFLPSHMTNQEIAEALFLSINTVKTHLRSAYRKLGVANRRQAIARGRRLDLL